MKVGTCGLDLELSLRFHADGALLGLHSVVVGGQELPPALANEFYAWLRDRRPFDQAEQDCWENAEPEQVSDPLRVA